MSLPMTALAALVNLAILVTAVAPVLLLVLWIRDWKRGELW